MVQCCLRLATRSASKRRAGGVAAFMETGFCQSFRHCIDVQLASGVNACGESRLPAALADARALTAALPTRH